MVELARKHFAYKKYWLKPSSDESPSLVVSTTGPRTLIQEAWIHSPGSRSYSTQPALPFSNCTIKESQYGWIPVEEKTDATNSDTVHGGNVRFLSLTLNDQFFYSMPNRATLNTFLNFTQTVMKGVARFQTSTASLQFELPAVSRVAGKNIALLPKNPLPPACCHGTARRLRQKS